MNAFHLIQLKNAIRMEEHGMRHSSGRSANAHAAKILGLPGRPNRKTVIAAIDAALAKIKSGEIEDTGPVILTA